jgi:hypothetical protein
MLFYWFVIFLKLYVVITRCIATLFSKIGGVLRFYNIIHKANSSLENLVCHRHVKTEECNFVSTFVGQVINDDLFCLYSWLMYVCLCNIDKMHGFL